MKKTVKLLCLSISLLLMLNIFTLFAPSGVFAANYYGFETAEEYEAAKKAAEEAAKKAEAEMKAREEAEAAAKKAAEEAAKKAAEEEAKKVAEEAAKKAAEEAANQKALEAKLEAEKKAAEEALKKAEKELRAIEEAEKRAEKLNRIRLENEIKKAGAINATRNNSNGGIFGKILSLFIDLSTKQENSDDWSDYDPESDWESDWESDEDYDPETDMESNREPEIEVETEQEEVEDNGSYTTLCLTHTLSEDESYYIITGLNMGYAPAGQLNVAIPMAYYDIYMKEIADNAFRGSSMSNIEIPVTIAKIGSYAFADCKKLNKIRYQGSIRQWKNIEFGENWNYGENKFYVMCEDGILTQDDLNSAPEPEEQDEVPDNGKYTAVCVKYAPSEDGSYYVITGLDMRNAPEGQLNIAIPTASYGIYMREIYDYAFCGSVISNIIIPESITKIGSYAFANCKKLNKIRYQGTMRQWVNLDFGKNWGAGTSGFDVVCNDGTFSY